MTRKKNDGAMDLNDSHFVAIDVMPEDDDPLAGSGNPHDDVFGIADGVVNHHYNELDYYHHSYNSPDTKDQVLSCKQSD